MKILGYNLDFPEIVGVSTRQKWYAEQLREEYVRENEERFDEINEIVTLEVDRRDLDYNDEHLQTFEMKFNEYEKVCLFSTNALTVISKLKEALYSDGANEELPFQ